MSREQFHLSQSRCLLNIGMPSRMCLWLLQGLHCCFSLPVRGKNPNPLVFANYFLRPTDVFHAENSAARRLNLVSILGMLIVVAHVTRLCALTS